MGLSKHCYSITPGHLCRIPSTVSLIIFFLFALRADKSFSQRPNIIFIMTDDMGYGDLGSYGQTKFATPNLDTLAAQGTRFINAYAAAPVCTPTRTALMTGRYPARTPVGLMEPLRSPAQDSAYGLTKDIPSLALLLQQNGYKTALVGKWHLGFMPAQSPRQNGFDYFYGIHSGGADYISFRGSNGIRAHDLYENETTVYPRGYMTDLLAAQSARFIREPHDRPFFLNINFTAPHWPWQGPGDPAYDDTTHFTAGGSPAVYAAMMKSLDDAIGLILSALDETGLNDQTLVIFTNDNGGERFSDNGGLSRGKMTLWEGGIRVPAFVRWPGRIPAGVTTEQVAITMDWTVTILQAAGISRKESKTMDGIDLMPVMTGVQKPVNRTLYWRTFQRSKHKAVLDGHWKYLLDEKGEYLFNLAEDPGEKSSLHTTELKKFKTLKKKLAVWERSVLTPIPL